jgi:GcrA cell cycle regulator
VRGGESGGALPNSENESGVEMAWCAETTATLHKLWGEGLTAAAISARIPGTTRNSVIGKAHREKLPERRSYNLHQSKDRKRAKLAGRARVLNTHAKLPKPKSKAPSPLSRALVELAPNQCRWPTDPGFCGHPKGEHPSYCEFHARRSCI